MVNFCAIVGCANRAGRDKDKSFYRLPAIFKSADGAVEREETAELASGNSSKRSQSGKLPLHQGLF